MPQLRKMKLKVCLVGERAVGKTSLIQRYVFNTFDDAYRGTLGTKMYLLSFSKFVATNQLVDAQIALFDLMGEHAPRDAFRDAMFWGAHAYLAVADLSRPETIPQLVPWVEAVRSVAGEIPYTILLNKSDKTRGIIGPNETRFLTEKFRNVPSAMTSAKTGEGVAQAFNTLIERVVEGVLQRGAARRELNAVAEKILAFAHRRGPQGVTRGDLLVAFRGMDYNALIAEVKDLERLGYVASEEIGPANFRIMLLPPGEAAVLKQGRTEDFIVEEPT